jgi:hypothetical protein
MWSPDYDVIEFSCSGEISADYKCFEQRPPEGKRLCHFYEVHHFVDSSLKFKDAVASCHGTMQEHVSGHIKEDSVTKSYLASS